jgi:hypothetical protein
MSDPDFQHLADAICARRLALVAPQDPRPAITPETLATKLRISHATVAANLETECHWASGSVDAVLAGGSPTPQPGLPEWLTPKPRRRGVAPDVQFRPAVTEDVIGAAVAQARAVVELADLRDRLEAECEQLEAKVVERDRWLKAASEQEEKLRERLWAVTGLHAEATQAVCGDGCCHEGLGVCGYCDEPYPCATARAAGEESA